MLSVRRQGEKLLVSRRLRPAVELKQWRTRTWRAKGKTGWGGEREGGKELLSHSSKSPSYFVTQGSRLRPGMKQTALCNHEGDLLKRTLTEALLTSRTTWMLKRPEPRGWLKSWGWVSAHVVATLPGTAQLAQVLPLHFILWRCKLMPLPQMWKRPVC